MAYTMQINYTSNENKAAKLKIKDDAGKTILKSEITLPSWIHQRDSYSMASELVLNSFIPEQYSQSNRYADITKITEFHQLFGKYYIGDKDKTSALKIIKKEDFNSEKTLQAINDCFTLSEDSFNILKNLLVNQYTVSITLNKKWYIFGQKSCIKNSATELNSYISLGEYIKEEEENIKQQIIEQENKRNSRGLKSFIQAALNFGASLISNNATQTNSSKTAQQITMNKSSKNSSYKTENEGYTSGIFASFMQVSETLTDSICNSVAHKSSDSSSYTSSCTSSDYSSPSFD